MVSWRYLAVKIFGGRYVDSDASAGLADWVGAVMEHVICFWARSRWGRSIILLCTWHAFRF